MDTVIDRQKQYSRWKLLLIYGLEDGHNLNWGIQQRCSQSNNSI